MPPKSPAMSFRTEEHPKPEPTQKTQTWNKENWETYHKAIEHDESASPLLINAVSHVEHTDIALDIGAGTLNETKHLIKEAHFKKVIAIDPYTSFARYTEDLKEELEQGRLETVQTTAEGFTFTPVTYDYIQARNSLFFISPQGFMNVWENMYTSLKEGGVLSGTLLGVHDDWNTENNTELLNYHTHEDIEKLLERYEVLFMREVEEDSSAILEQAKHWHTFVFIVRKKHV